MTFSTNPEDIQGLINLIDPEAYGKTRNFIDGSVTHLSPYISRGVISTRTVMNHILSLELPFYKIEKLIQELARRDYWQQVWIAKGGAINDDLKNEQEKVTNHSIPKAIINKETGIEAIDKAIDTLYLDGYMHNHLRMYTASLACNVAGSHWLQPAKWMYYHLLDGDWASNALSWQWVAGSNANKKYLANQDNINKYCYTNQQKTFLDIPYHHFDKLEIPEHLSETESPKFHTTFPKSDQLRIDSSNPTLIYNYYNLDSEWRKGEDANRIFLLEPSVFEQYPIGQNPMAFALGLSDNIPDIQVFVGEFDELRSHLQDSQIIFKEHPLNTYEGIEDQRDWMFNVTGYYPSFFAFWKKCKREIKSSFNFNE